MSGALHSWYSLPDLMSLAERGAVLEGTIAIAKFERLTELLYASEGSAQARMSFRQGNGGTLLVELKCEAVLELVCQRCLKAVVHEVCEQVEFAVAENDDSLTVLPKDLTLITLDGDRFQPATLIEDELIVSLPLIAKHDDEKN